MSNTANGNSAESDLANALWQASGASHDDTWVVLEEMPPTLSTALSYHMRTGRVDAVHLIDAESLRQKQRVTYPARRSVRQPVADPRLKLLDGRIDLLPFPAQSAKFVAVHGILSRIQYSRERLDLLSELTRTVAADGTLYIIEPLLPNWRRRLTGSGSFSAETLDALLRKAALKLGSIAKVGNNSVVTVALR